MAVLASAGCAGAPRERPMRVLGGLRIGACAEGSGPSALLLLLLIASVGWCTFASADDAPPPPPGPRLERLFAPLKQDLASFPPFLRDTNLSTHYRIYYLNQARPNDTQSEALATGGWISYQSGWLLDTFSLGASLYGSAPLYAPADRDGTLLLKTGQKGYFVPGEAWGALRYGDYALLT